MEIIFSINNRKVDRAVFKTFSSQCEKWLNIIVEKENEIQAHQGKIELVYYPAWNIVVPMCKPSFLLSTLLGNNQEVPSTGIEKIMNTLKNKLLIFKIPTNMNTLEKI